MDITRALDLAGILQHKSCFLYGPRQTGKSWLIRHTLGQYRSYNLLESDTYLKLSRSPSRLREECTTDEKIVIIDEIQKLPALLDEIHALIEDHGIRFLLTGSSARKMRRGGVNLLGGRAWVRQLHPFCYHELQKHFDLLRAVNYGLLPPVFLSDMPEEDLQSYAGTYLREEIAAEGLTRNIPAFSRFLEVASLCNTRMINYTNIANDAQVARSTVQEYFQVLKDTLIACELPGWRKTIKRKAIGMSKLYFFDPGVVRLLQRRSLIQIGSPEFGEAFEHYIHHELHCFTDYGRQGELCYWNSASGFEVDFVLADMTAIEVKSSKTIGGQDFKGLRALKEEGKLKNYVLVCMEKEARTVDGIRVLPWKVFLEELWAGKLTE
ncbi:MAG: ATP-binding protein [Planctomycetes bacterium]|nr:ATP-binding protein [Planctomycetota bacterium]